MSLLRVSELRASEEEAPPPPSPWLPSHVQVTVGQARGLRAKGGPGDAAFVALQLGRQKHRTALASHKDGCPRWAEQCALELPPPPPPPSRAAGPDHDGGAQEEALLLQLTVWQRALVGMDRFLGRAALPLGALLQAGRSHQDRWYKLHSKPGKKEKERGEIQLSIHFTRHSLTASMFDLSSKEKPRSPFGKLKDKVRGRQKYDLESASAIVPSSAGALDEDLDPGGKKAKGKGFFFKNKLRKSSLTQSNTSLGSDSTVSSAGSMVAFGVAETVAPSPSWHSSLSADHPGRDVLPSPKPTHKRAFSDEVSQISLLPEAKSVQSLKAQKEPMSRSSLCINGSHIYCEEPSPKPSFLAPVPAPPAAPFPQTVGSKPDEDFGAGPQGPEPELPPWSSSGFQKGPPKDPPRFIPSPPILAAQEEDKLSVKTIALNKHRSRIKMEESRPAQIAAPVVFSTEARKVRPREEEARKEDEAEQPSKTGFFRRGSGKEEGGKQAAVESGEPSPRAAAAAAVAGGRERGRSSSGGSWFSLQDAKEAPPKPSSPSGLLAATEDASSPADHGPSPSASLGSLRAAPATPSPSGPESRPLVSPARGPPEWDDGFDALATSRLRPGGHGEAPGLETSTDAVRVDCLAEANASVPAAELSLPRAGRPHGSGGAAGAGPVPLLESPAAMSSAPEDALLGEARVGDQASREQWEGGVPAEEPSGEPPVEVAPLVKAGEQEPPGESLLWSEPAAERGTEGPVQAAERGRLPQTAPDAFSSVHGQPWESSSSQGAALEQVVAEEETPPLGPPQERGATELAAGLWGRTTPVSGAEARGPGLAGPCPWDPEGAEELQTILGVERLPLEASETVLGAGQDHTGKEDWVEVREQGRGAEGKAEPPPPKPPRRFTPLSLEKEASELECGAQARRHEGVPRDVEQGEPVGGAHWPGLSAGPADAPAGPATSPVPRTIIGAGAGSSQSATEGLPADASESAAANGLRGPGSSSGDVVPAVDEGGRGAEQIETCPSELSLGDFALPGAEDSGCCQGGEDPAPSVAAPALPERISARQAREPPMRVEGEAVPSRTSPEPLFSPSVLFWTAVEEHQLQESQGHAGLQRLEEQEPTEGGPLGLGPNLEQESRVVPPGLGEGPAKSPVSPAPPAVSPFLQVLAGGLPPQGQGDSLASESERSSDWSDDRVLDFKRADFWQAGVTEPSSKQGAVVTSGNPFASCTGPPPSPQNNPFVETPPGALLAEAAVLRVSPIEGPNFRDLCAETAAAGLLPAKPPGTLPIAHFLHGGRPLAFSTPSIRAAADHQDGRFPSPLAPPATSGSRSPAGHPSLPQPQPSTDASAPSLSPVETQLAQEGPLWQADSPHLVRPIPVAGRREPEPCCAEQQREAVGQSPPGSGGQEKSDQRAARGGIGSAVPALRLAKPESERDPSVPDRSAKYYHLTHDELIQLLLKREAELGQKQEHVRELENYIDRLLVRIMEQSPTLLQIPLGEEPLPAAK